MLLYSGQTSNG